MGTDVRVLGRSDLIDFQYRGFNNRLATATLSCELFLACYWSWIVVLLDFQDDEERLE